MRTKTKSPGTEAAPPFPFIVGCGRSGTSLLRALFDSHPDLTVPDDTFFIMNLSSRRRAYERGGGFDLEAFLADLTRQFTFERWPVGIDAIGKDLRADPPADYPDAIRRLFAVCARSQAKRRYGNKSPVHVRSMGVLARMFPEARFVHVIRDGRNVALSYLQVDFGPRTVEEAALRWKRHVRSGRRSGKALGPARYQEVRYEQLLDDPEAAVRPLCRFVDLEFDERMLRYYERASALHPGRDPKHHRNLSLPPTKGLRDWHTEMPPGDVETFEAIAGRLLDELGYARGAPRPDAAVRTRAAGRLLGVGARAGMRKLGVVDRKPSGAARVRRS